MLGVGSWSEIARAHDPISTKVTWTREISALFERRCVSCHVRDGFAGFSLATYEEARPWAVAIKEVVLAGDMPPWGAAPGVGHFANDRRPTRHDQELVASWVDGGAPYSLEAPRPNRDAPTPMIPLRQPPAGGVAIPLAPADITEATERTASVTLQLPAGMHLTSWAFEPGIPALIRDVELELGARWLGTWTPGDARLEFPPDAAAPLTTSAMFTARVTYRAPAARLRDFSRLRIWIAKEARPKTVREATVVRSWRAPAAVEVFALRPSGDTGDAEVVARFTDGRAEPLALLAAPDHAPHPTYRLARPLLLAAGARVETTAPIRLLYSTGATRTVNSNVRRRPRR
jgi:hypothetical protein